MKDYRAKENRVEYFTDLYRMNLQHGVMPGLVYLYMPKLAERYGWDAEQKLWFAFLNGNTQNPITSLRIMQEFPTPVTSDKDLKKFTDWFNANWETLSFDTDRRYQKKELPLSVQFYGGLVELYGSQEKLLTGSFSELWDRVISKFHSFGRLATFSYLEYVKIMGFGAECDNLFLEDKSGSKSHRNGLLFLLGLDHLVWDKRMGEASHDGKYGNFHRMCEWLTNNAMSYLQNCEIEHKDAGFFTLESQCCQFKNGFFRRRYPGVYADMAWDRIKWYEDRDMGDLTKVFRQIREDNLPEWLRMECEDNAFKYLNHVNKRASKFADTGVPFRAEYFM